MAKEQKEKSTFDLYEAWKKRKGKKMNKGSDEMITPKVKIITPPPNKQDARPAHQHRRNKNR